MRGFAGLAGLLITMVLGLLVYKFYFTSGQAALNPAAPTQTVDMIGAKSDLLSMAQAERIYRAEHSSYGSLDDLVSSGALAYKREGRHGYTYDSESSTDSFRITARCTDPPLPGCMGLAIDQNMQIAFTQ
jgi:hypothetical protein